MAQQNAGWHQENIKAELRKRFGSLRLFAQAQQVSKQAVSGALASPTRSSRVELLIASALEVPPHLLWPDRWTSDGKKIDRAEFRLAERAAKAAA